MLDRRAAELARGVGATMLRLGEVLGQLGARGGHHELGFSSLGAYVRERCGRGSTWGRELVRVARELERWPRLRGALLAGEVTWSAVEVVLRALRPLGAAEAALAAGVLEQAEEVWLERARRLSVRELRDAVRDAARWPRDAAREPRDAAREPRGPETAVHPYLRRLPTHVLTLTVPVETAWWFECARRVHERSVSDCGAGARSTEGFVLALLAEARTELGASEVGSAEAVERWGSYVAQLAVWRDEAERRCDVQRRALGDRALGDVAHGGGATPAGEPPVGESMLVGAMVHDGDGDGAPAFECRDRGASGQVSGGEPDVRRAARDRDVRVQELVRGLARRDLDLGALATWLQRAEAWRRLGFASEAHYVRERMGMSYSQWKSKRRLARSLGALPQLEAVVRDGVVGVESAALLVGVISRAREQLGRGDVGAEAIERAWVERAGLRTHKHLREEIRAAELAAQQWDVPALPPSEETMRRFSALQGRVASGAVLLEGAEGEVAGADRGEVARRAWLDLRGELREVFRGAFLSDPGEPDVRREPGVCPPAPGGRKGPVRLRLLVERDTLVEYRCLERKFRRLRRGGGDFLEFLCRHFLAVWAPAMLTDVKYAHVYRRDAFTCTSPVCERHDVQPHHLRFRSAGGGEEHENLASLCTWCHLEGVHGGRIRVAPPASSMRWELGGGFLRVHGREVMR